MVYENPEWDAIRAEHRSAHKTTREYEVTGNHKVFGHEPGSVVELTLTEGEERALLDSGHIALHDEGEPLADPPVEEAAVAAESASVVTYQDDLN